MFHAVSKQMISRAFGIAVASVTWVLFSVNVNLPPSYSQETDAAGLMVRVTGIDGTTQRQELESISSDAVVRFGDGQTIHLDQLRQLRSDVRLLGDDKTTTTVYLSGKGVLHARSVVVKDGVLSVETDLADLQYPLLAVRGIRPPTKQGETEWSALLREPSREEDRLLVTTSLGPRVVAGLLEEFDAEGVRILFEDAQRRVAIDKILGIVPAMLVDDGLPKYEVQVIDRSVLIADSVEFNAGKWTLAWKEQSFSFPADLVASIRIRSDRMFFVSDLDPVIDEVQTLLAPVRANRRNLSVIGTPISLRLPAEQTERSEKRESGRDRSDVGEIREFALGWGVRARSRGVFENTSGYTHLNGWVGIDTATAGHGSCLASIFLDGIQVASHEVRGDQNAIPIRIPLNGARRLELLVEPGLQLDLADWVNWADLRVIK